MTVALESRMARQGSRAEEPAGISCWQPSLGASKELMISERSLRKMKNVFQAAKP